MHLSLITHLNTPLRRLPFANVIHEASLTPTSDRIHKIALPYIKSLTSLYYLTQGAKNTYSDNEPYEEKESDLITYQSYLNRLHGALYFGNGIADGCEALQAFAKKSVFRHLATLRHIGSGCFFLANCIELDANFARYQKGVLNDSTHAKRSATLGIITNLSYMAAAIFTPFKFYATLRVSFTVLACTINVIKIVYGLICNSKVTPSKSIT